MLTLLPLQRSDTLEFGLKFYQSLLCFDKNYNNTAAIDYGNVNLSLSPSYRIIQDDLTVDLGVRLTYLNDTELNDNKLFIYPNIEASYSLVNDILIISVLSTFFLTDPTQSSALPACL